MPLGFIGTTEILWIMILGLLLFGGRLPEVAKDLGRAFFKAKRSLDEIRRDSGIDDALRDLQRETESLDRTARDFADEARRAAEDVPDWRQALGPGAAEPVAEGETEDRKEPAADQDEEAEGSDSQQSGPEQGPVP